MKLEDIFKTYKVKKKENLSKALILGAIRGGTHYITYFKSRGYMTVLGASELKYIPTNLKNILFHKHPAFDKKTKIPYVYAENEEGNKLLYFDPINGEYLK